MYENNIGFSLDTARHKAICCDALFREIVRGHLNKEQLSVCEARFSQQEMAAPASTADTSFSLLYAPFEAGLLTFVLVENAISGKRSALLVVMRRTGDGILTIMEQSPLCRSRIAAKDQRPAH